MKTLIFNCIILATTAFVTNTEAAVVRYAAKANRGYGSYIRVGANQRKIVGVSRSGRDARRACQRKLRRVQRRWSQFFNARCVFDKIIERRPQIETCTAVAVRANGNGKMIRGISKTELGLSKVEACQEAREECREDLRIQRALGRLEAPHARCVAQ